MGGPRPSSDVPIPRVASCETKQVAPVGIQVRFRRAVKFSVRRQTVRKLAPTSARPVQTRVRGAMAPWTTTPGSETRGAGAPPSTNGTPSTAYLNRARELAERVQASLGSNVRHDALLRCSGVVSGDGRSRRRAPRSSWTSSSPRAGTADGDPRRRRQPPEGGDRPRGDDTSVGGDGPPRSPHPPSRDDDDDDPATPTPPGGTTNAAGESTTPTAHPRTPSPTPPTPVDPIEALLSKAVQRGADLPVVIVAGESDENVGREDDDRGRHGHHEQTPTPQQTPPSAPNAAREKIRARRESNPRPQGSPPIAFTPLPAPFRAADLTARAADAQSRFDSERRRNDRLARKLTRAESRRAA